MCEPRTYLSAGAILEPEYVIDDYQSASDFDDSLDGSYFDDESWATWEFDTVVFFDQSEFDESLIESGDLFDDGTDEWVWDTEYFDESYETFPFGNDALIPDEDQFDFNTDPFSDAIDAWDPEWIVYETVFYEIDELSLDIEYFETTVWDDAFFDDSYDWDVTQSEFDEAYFEIAFDDAAFNDAEFDDFWIEEDDAFYDDVYFDDEAGFYDVVYADPWFWDYEYDETVAVVDDFEFTTEYYVDDYWDWDWEYVDDSVTTLSVDPIADDVIADASFDYDGFEFGDIFLPEFTDTSFETDAFDTDVTSDSSFDYDGFEFGDVSIPELLDTDFTDVSVSSVDVDSEIAVSDFNFETDVFDDGEFFEIGSTFETTEIVILTIEVFDDGSFDDSGFFGSDSLDTKQGITTDATFTASTSLNAGGDDISPDGKAASPETQLSSLVITSSDFGAGNSDGKATGEAELATNARSDGQSRNLRKAGPEDRTDRIARANGLSRTSGKLSRRAAEGSVRESVARGLRNHKHGHRDGFKHASATRATSMARRSDEFGASQARIVDSHPQQARQALPDVTSANTGTPQTRRAPRHFDFRLSRSASNVARLTSGATLGQQHLEVSYDQAMLALQGSGLSARLSELPALDNDIGAEDAEGTATYAQVASAAGAIAITGAAGFQFSQKHGWTLLFKALRRILSRV